MAGNQSDRTAVIVSFVVAVLGVAAVAGAGAPFPLKVGPTGRYLVDRNGNAFLIAGESPQAMMVNVSEKDADLFFANRQSHGFNTVWINLICNTYTGGREDGTTIDGLRPFAHRFDFSQPQEDYFAHCDRIVELAAKHGMLVMLDPAETGGFLKAIQSNGGEKCREYGRYVGRRYAHLDNLLWFHGNDYNDHNAQNDALVTAIALGIKEFDTRHLHTIETEADDGGHTSLDDLRWEPIVGLSGAYSYGPVYVPIFRDYNRKTNHRVPTFMVESSYEFEKLGGAQLGTPRQLRWEEYTSDLSGTTGQMYGNKYTWPFLPGWKEKLDTPGAVQMAYVTALFESRSWYAMVPDQDHELVTDGWGKFGDFSYASAARTPDGKLAMVYVPDKRAIKVDLSKLSGPVTARWYDPSKGTFRPVSGSPFAAAGSQPFTTPGPNADGDADWVLVLEVH